MIQKKISGRISSFADFVNESYNASDKLTQKIKDDLSSLRLDGQSPNEVRVSSDGMSITADFDDLGNWVHDEENSYDREQDDPDWREDDDQMVWAPGEYKRYKTKFEDWAKSKGWIKNVELSLDQSEKNWCSFTVDIKSVKESKINEDGYGQQSFVFSKNGDTCYYFFKITRNSKENYSFVLSIGKFAKFAQPAEAKQAYAVLSLTQLTEEQLDQAIIDEGKFENNESAIQLEDGDLTRLFGVVSICVTDYLQKNPKVVMFYDEIQNTLKSPNYTDRFATSLPSWPGDNWHMQEVEPSKLNTITK